jgi:hypothetical protein
LANDAVSLEAGFIVSLTAEETVSAKFASGRFANGIGSMKI